MQYAIVESRIEQKNTMEVCEHVHYSHSLLQRLYYATHKHNSITVVRVSYTGRNACNGCMHVSLYPLGFCRCLFKDNEYQIQL